jgi:hypothetical protein
MEFKNHLELEQQGYTVVKAVLTEEEGEFAKGLFVKWWAANSISERPIPPHGIIKHWGIGHTAFAWYIRTRARVVEAFADIWGTDDLVVSFDGACYMPLGLDRKNQKKGWLHIDQAAKTLGFVSVQGFVALTSNTQATLGVVPNSHLDFVANVSDVENRSRRFNPMPQLPPSLAIKVEAEAGDLVLWDSRVAHMNFYGDEPRLVQYVSYLPRAQASAADLKKRRDYWYKRRTTSHWAYPLQVVALQPQTFGDSRLEIDYSEVVDPIDEAVWGDMAQEINSLI